LRDDLKGLTERLNSLNSVLGNNPENFFLHFPEFLRVAKIRLSEASMDFKKLESLRTELASFFCEPPKQFSLEVYTKNDIQKLD
jgi:hypothetical protein